MREMFVLQLKIILRKNKKKAINNLTPWPKPICPQLAKI